MRELTLEEIELVAGGQETSDSGYDGDGGGDDGDIQVSPGPTDGDYDGDHGDIGDSGGGDSGGDSGGGTVSTPPVKDPGHHKGC